MSTIATLSSLLLFEFNIVRSYALNNILSVFHLPHIISARIPYLLLTRKSKLLAFTNYKLSLTE